MLIDKAIIIIITASIAIGGYWIYRRSIMYQASRITEEIYSIWAALGPFKNGRASADAMHFANIVVREQGYLDGPKYKEAISLHEKAYSADPEKWEELRQKSLSIATGEKFERQLAMVKEMAANDIALRKIEDQLRDDGSKESKDLISFLNELYKRECGIDRNDTMKRGFLYAQVYLENLRHPDESFYEIFLKLNDALEKNSSFPNGVDLSKLEFSNKPESGCPDETSCFIEPRCFTYTEGP